MVGRLEVGAPANKRFILDLLGRILNQDRSPCFPDRFFSLRQWQCHFFFRSVNRISRSPSTKAHVSRAIFHARIGRYCPDSSSMGTNSTMASPESRARWDAMFIPGCLHIT